MGYAVVGMALGFLLEGIYAPVSLKLDVLVAYVIAAGAAWLWTAPDRSVAAPEGSSGWLECDTAAGPITAVLRAGAWASA